MNWTTRIEQIVKRMFPFEGKCAWQKQAALRARISRSDRIKRELVGKTVEEQHEIINRWEARINN